MGGLIQNDIDSAHWASQSDTKTADPYLMGDIPSNTKGRVGFMLTEFGDSWLLLSISEGCVCQREKRMRGKITSTENLRN